MSSRPTRRAAAAKRKPIVEEPDSDDEINDSAPAEESEDDFTPAPPKSARKSVGPAARRRKTTEPPLQTETPPSASSAGRRPGRARKSVARDTAEPSVEPNASIQDESSTQTAAASRRRGRPKKNAIKEETAEPEAIVAPSIQESTTVQPSIEKTEQDQDAVPDHTAMDIDQEEPPVKKTPAKKRKSLVPRAASKAARLAKAPPTPAPAPEPQVEPEPPASANPISSPRPSGEPEPVPEPEREPEPERFQTPLADITEAASNDQRPAVEDTLLNTVKPVKPLDTILEKPMDIVLKSRTMVLPQVEDTTPKPRLVIRYLILNNFKSYAGRQEVGPFHASFSSVVGPNGSGKSNVIDSLLFVFGFRASKMRQGKLSALIHNSAQYPNLDHCEVAVHFNEVLDHVCDILLLWLRSFTNILSY